MKLGSVVSLSALATVLVVGSAYLAFGVVRVDWFSEYTTAEMTLTNSGGLVARSPVLLAGIRVGEVTSVANIATGVEVKFRFADTYRIPAASTVSIENLSALGEPYIRFTPTKDDGRYIHDGQQISTSAVAMPLSIPEMARTVTDLLNQLDPHAIGSVIDTLAQGLAGTESVIPPLARSTNLLAATLLSRTPEINSALIDMQTIASDMTWVGPSMANAAPTWTEMGHRIDLVVAAFANLARSENMPAGYTRANGLLPFVTDLSAYLDRIGPDLQQLAPAIAPLAASAAGSLHQIDLSALIAQALNSVGDDGVLRLQISVK